MNSLKKESALKKRFNPYDLNDVAEIHAGNASRFENSQKESKSECYYICRNIMLDKEVRDYIALKYPGLIVQMGVAVDHDEKTKK